MEKRLTKLKESAISTQVAAGKVFKVLYCTCIITVLFIACITIRDNIHFSANLKKLYLRYSIMYTYIVLVLVHVQIPMGKSDCSKTLNGLCIACTCTCTYVF